MARAFSCLPFVDNCCLCVYNLIFAAYIISFISVLDGMSGIFRVVTPPCHNMRSSTAFGTTVLVTEILVSVAGVFLVMSSILLGITTLNNKPVVKPFIVLTWLENSLVVVLVMVYVARMASLNFICKQNYFGKTKTFNLHPSVFVLHLFTTILSAAIMTYYTIVVNSYARLWDEYDGNIPTNRLEPPQRPVMVVIKTSPGNAQGSQSPPSAPPGSPYSYDPKHRKPGYYYI